MLEQILIRILTSPTQPLAEYTSYHNTANYTFL